MTDLLAELKENRDHDRELFGSDQPGVMAAWSEAISIAERHVAPDLVAAVFLEAYWQTHSTPLIRQIHPEYRARSDQRARELLAEHDRLRGAP